MCEHRARKRADYESADSPHFLPSDLLGGLFWADCWTTEGGWLSSETLNGANLPSHTMVDYFRQPFSVSLNNKRKDPFCFLYVELANLSFSLTTFVTVIILKICPLIAFLVLTRSTLKRFKECFRNTSFTCSKFCFWSDVGVCLLRHLLCWADNRTGRRRISFQHSA